MNKRLESLRAMRGYAMRNTNDTLYFKFCKYIPDGATPDKLVELALDKQKYSEIKSAFTKIYNVSRETFK